MYTRRNTGLGDWSDVLSQVLTTGEQIFKDSRTPVNPSPTFRLPTTPPFVNPITGQFQPAPSNLMLPLAIGAGVLLLVLMTRKGRTT